MAMRDPQLLSEEDEAIMRFEEENIPDVAAMFGVDESVVEGVLFRCEDWHSLSFLIDQEYSDRRARWDAEREEAKLEAQLSRLDRYDEYGRWEPMT